MLFVNSLCLVIFCRDPPASMYRQRLFMSDAKLCLQLNSTIHFVLSLQLVCLFDFIFCFYLLFLRDKKHKHNRLCSVYVFYLLFF